MQRQVPELHDGAYWYAQEVTGRPQGIGGLSTQGRGALWYAVVGGVEYAVIRTKTPILLPPVGEDVKTVLQAAYDGGSLSSVTKPFARL